jgi:hypothetical protein
MITLLHSAITVGIRGTLDIGIIKTVGKAELNNPSSLYEPENDGNKCNHQ